MNKIWATLVSALLFLSLSVSTVCIFALTLD
jgi:hypothetical protein